MITTARRFAALLALLVLTLGAAAGAASARPVTPIATPGGLSPQQAREPIAFGDCATSGVHCRPDLSGTCQQGVSQSTPPTDIKVYVPTDTQNPIESIPFETYVENVLPNEWVPTWDGDALKAGAVAVKSYAWYWALHFGGYIDNDPSQCFDVTDDENFQVYQAGSATTRTTTAVADTWFVTARTRGQVLETSYQSYLDNADESCGAYANGSVMSQVGTQACVDSDENRGGSTGNKYNVILAKYYYPGLQLTTTQQQRTQHDFTFEHTSTPATFSAGTWNLGDGYGTVLHHGQAGDIPAITDDGDGFAHVTVWRPSNGHWYIGSPTGNTAQTVSYGLKGDIPVAAHYDGIGKATVLAVFRPSNHSWYLSGHSPVSYGSTGDTPVPGDYDGDGTTDLAVWHPSTAVWYLGSPTGTTLQRIQYGERGDIPVPADYNGDGTTDIAIYRPSTHQFWVRGTSQPVSYGIKGDVPVTGDFTGDGKADFAMYRPSTQTFYVYGHAAVHLGPSGATPIGSAPYRG